MGKRGEEGGVPEGGREGGDRLDGKRKAGRYAFFELGVGGRGGLREQTVYDTQLTSSQPHPIHSPFCFRFLPSSSGNPTPSKPPLSLPQASRRARARTKMRMLHSLIAP